MGVSSNAQWNGDTLNVLSDFAGSNAFEWVTDVEFYKNDGYVLVGRMDTLPPWQDGNIVGFATFDPNGVNTGTRKLATTSGYTGLSLNSSNCHRWSDGSFAVAYSLINTPLTQTAVLVRLTPEMDSLWSVIYPNDSSWVSGFQVNQLVGTMDHGYALSGTRSGPAAAGLDQAVLIRVDSLGQEMWRTTFGDSALFDLPLACVTTEDNGFVLAGGQNTNGGCRNGWYVRLDGVGDVLWSLNYRAPLSCDNQFNAVISASTGGYVMTGTCYSGWPAEQSLLTVAFNDDGDTLWTSRLYGFGGFWNTGLDIIEHPNGNFMIAGILNVSAETSKGQVACLSPQGDLLWQYGYSCQDTAISNGYMRLSSIILDLDSSSLICGGVAPAHPGAPAQHTDGWLIRIQPDGCLVPGCNLLTNVMEQTTDLASSLLIAPNPAHDLINVRISLPENYVSNGDLLLTIISTDGRRIQEKRLPMMVEQGHQIDTRDLPSGSYHVHLSDGRMWLAGKNLIIQ
jgi:hypothetical protein